MLLCGQKKGNLNQYVCIEPSQLLHLWRGGVRVCARSCHFFQLDAWTKAFRPGSGACCFQSTQRRGTSTIAFPRPQRTRLSIAQVGRDPQGPRSPAPGSTRDHPGIKQSIHCPGSSRTAPTRLGATTHSDLKKPSSSQTPPSPAPAPPAPRRDAEPSGPRDAPSHVRPLEEKYPA